MPRLVFQHTEELRHAADAQGIVEKLASIGYDISLRDAHAAWEAYSDSMCAGWMICDDEDPETLLMKIRPYVAEEPDTDI